MARVVPYLPTGIFFYFFILIKLIININMGIVDLSAPEVVHKSNRAAMDCPYSVHRPDLRDSLLDISVVLQQRELLRVLFYSP